MLAEVDSAVNFLSRILGGAKLARGRMDMFKEMLQVFMMDHYQNHWFPEKPFKGSGYRCLRIVNQKMDPLITKAGGSIGLSESDLLNVLPRELTMWIDPAEVSYRIGEEGSIGVLYGPDADSSSDSSECDSNRSTPNPQSNTMSQSQGIFQQQHQSCSQEQLRSSPASNGASQVSQDHMNNWEYYSTYVAS